MCSSLPSCFPVSEARRFITTLGTCSGMRSTSCCALARLDSSSLTRLLFGGNRVAMSYTILCSMVYKNAGYFICFLVSDEGQQKKLGFKRALEGSACLTWGR